MDKEQKGARGRRQEARGRKGGRGRCRREEEKEEQREEEGATEDMGRETRTRGASRGREAGCSLLPILTKTTSRTAKSYSPRQRHGQHEKN